MLSSNLTVLWLAFLACTAAIVWSGMRLSKYGDVLAEKTGLGRTWIGVVLMASVTSLPELVTGASSVTFAGVPDIAVGDVLGSCVFNIFILAILDLFTRSVPVSAKAHHGHVLSAGFGVLMIGLVAISMVTGKNAPPLGWISLSTLVIIVLYLIAMRTVFFYEKRQIAKFLKEVAEELKYEDIPTKTAVTRYGINAAIVVAAAVFLPTIGEHIAEVTGLGQSFVGNIFIAFSTSLPEVVVSITALRVGAIDLAIGNLFGSNIFNICILAIDDLLYTRGPLLADVAGSHLISAVSAIIMTAIAIIGLTYRAERKQLFLAWDSIGIVIIYVVNTMFLYLFR